MPMNRPGHPLLAWPIATLPITLFALVLGGAWSLVHSVRMVRLRSAHVSELWNEFAAYALLAMVTVLALRWATTWFDRRAHAWSGLRWLIPGVLGAAVLRLAFELPVSIEAALEPVPVPSLADGVGAGVWDPTRYILASRVVLGLQVAALLTLLAAFVALARGWRSLPLLTIATVLLALGAPLRMAIRDWCCPFADGPAFEQHVVAWVTMLALAVIGALAWRRPRATPRAE